MSRLRKNIFQEDGIIIIELMVVVAIVGVLAALTLPNFLSYQLRTKTSEAKTTLGALKVSLESFNAEWDAYIPCGATLVGANATKQPWPNPARSRF